MKGIMRFGKKGKLSPRYIEPYKILRRIGQVAYELELPSELEFVHPVFHVSMLRKCIGDPSRVVPIKDVQVTEDLSYEEVPVGKIDREVLTWEAEKKMKSKYPYLFQNEDNKDAGGRQDTLEEETAL